MSAVVDRIVEALNRGDVEGFVAGYSEDAAIEDGQGALIARGRDGLRGRYGPLFASTPELRCEVLSRVVVGEYVVDHERITGREPEPELAVVVYHLRDGLVDHERIIR